MVAQDSKNRGRRNFKNSLSHTQDVEKYPAHIRPYYPKSGGYGRVIEAIAADINKYIKFNTKVTKLIYDKMKKFG